MGMQVPSRQDSAANFQGCIKALLRLYQGYIKAQKLAVEALRPSTFLYMCPHASMCPHIHASIYVSSYSAASYFPLYVSSCLYICVLIPLRVLMPLMYVSSYYYVC